MRSANSSHSFAQVAKAEIPRTAFNRTHNIKTTFDGSFLIPIFVDEALPGDTHTLKMHTFARLATPIHPLLDNMHLESFFFAVPLRLLWDNFEKFMGAQDAPGDSTSFEIPTITPTGGGFSIFSPYDYMGIPPSVAGQVDISALYGRAYNLIYTEWFRDQNLIDPPQNRTDDGPDSHTYYNLFKRGKRHDYFTSCLPWPSKGIDVHLPLGTSAPVISTGDPLDFTDGVSSFELQANGSNNAAEWSGIPASSTMGYDFGLEVDLTGSTGATINELRQAFQLQKLYERDARGGTRYVEMTRAHFGVTSPDARLQRPEYLGGGHQTINVTPVPQTSETDGTPLGELGAFGVSQGSNHGFNKSFTEHCIIIGLVSVRSDISYDQGVNRKFTRKNRFDFYFPALAHIGEQVVQNREIYSQGSGDLAADIAAFGYQERFAEYRYFPNQVTGKFRGGHPQTLNPWILTENFGSLPTLGETFIEDPSETTIERAIAVSSEPHFLFDALMELRSVRPMPMFGTPGNIDRF